jgi:hypothetical protein
VPCTRALAIVLALLAVVAHAARAQAAADRPGGPGLQTFVQQYVAAIRAHDVAAITRLTHPASLACIDDATREFFDFVLAREVTNARTAAGYRIVRVAPVPPGASHGVPPDLFRYPVPATHEFQVELGTDAASTTVIRQIAQLDGAWYTVLPCPTTEGLERFREQQVQTREQRARAEALAAQLKEPLLSELRTLLGAQRRNDAIRRYREASGTDMTTAVGVVNVLSGRK